MEGTGHPGALLQAPWAGTCGEGKTPDSTLPQLMAPNLGSMLPLSELLQWPGRECRKGACRSRPLPAVSGGGGWYWCCLENEPVLIFLVVRICFEISEQNFGALCEYSENHFNVPIQFCTNWEFLPYFRYYFRPIEWFPQTARVPESLYHSRVDLPGDLQVQDPGGPASLPGKKAPNINHPPDAPAALPEAFCSMMFVWICTFLGSPFLSVCLSH